MGENSVFTKWVDIDKKQIKISEKQARCGTSSKSKNYKSFDLSYNRMIPSFYFNFLIPIKVGQNKQLHDVYYSYSWREENGT